MRLLFHVFYLLVEVGCFVIGRRNSFISISWVPLPGCGTLCRSTWVCSWFIRSLIWLTKVIACFSQPLTCTSDIMFRVGSFPQSRSCAFMSLVAWWVVRNRCLTWWRSQSYRVQYFPWFYRSIEVWGIRFSWWLPRTFSQAWWTTHKCFRSCAKSSEFFIRKRRIRGWEWLQNCAGLDGCRLRCTSLSSIRGA